MVEPEDLVEPEDDAAIAGTSAAWLDAVIDGRQGALEIRGDWRFPRDLLGGLHKALFGGRR